MPPSPAAGGLPGRGSGCARFFSGDSRAGSAGMPRTFGVVSPELVAAPAPPFTAAGRESPASGRELPPAGEGSTAPGPGSASGLGSLRELFSAALPTCAAAARPLAAVTLLGVRTGMARACNQQIYSMFVIEWVDRVPG